jgi:hypothetical protein
VGTSPVKGRFRLQQQRECHITYPGLKIVPVRSSDPSGTNVGTCAQPWITAAAPRDDKHPAQTGYVHHHNASWIRVLLGLHRIYVRSEAQTKVPELVPYAETQFFRAWLMRGMRRWLRSRETCWTPSRKATTKLPKLLLKRCIIPRWLSARRSDHLVLLALTRTRRLAAATMTARSSARDPSHLTAADGLTPQPSSLQPGPSLVCWTHKWVPWTGDCPRSPISLPSWPHRRGKGAWTAGATLWRQ